MDGCPETLWTTLYMYAFPIHVRVHIYYPWPDLATILHTEFIPTPLIDHLHHYVDIC